ncbi:class I SAM-dependent methyltransferase [soil metagenome]
MSVPPNFELVPCPGCGSREFTAAHVTHANESTGGESMQVVRCNQCGLHYLNPRPTAEYLLSFYPDDYAPYRLQRGEIERPWKIVTIARLLVMKNAYGRPDLRPTGIKKFWATVMSWFKSPKSCGEAIAYFGSGRLLDFGCGAGTFLRRMRAMGWSGTGIDFSEAPVKLVRNSGIPAYVGSLPCAELKPQSFDLITMRHVLEHIADPRTVLRAAIDLLAPGGELQIQSPNFSSFEIEHFGDAANMLDLPRHLIHWDVKTLRDMLEQCGYANIEVRQVCKSNSMRKSARRMDRSVMTRLDRWMAKSTMVCRWMALRCEQTGRGNELIAKATRPATLQPAAIEGQVADALV